MSRIQYHVSKPVLKWIAATQGFTIEDLANAVAPKKRDDFLSGIVNKTQAEKLTKMGKIPFGYLFLDTPPVLPKPTIPDFRSVEDKIPLSDNFYELLEDIENKVDWYRDFLKEHDAYEKLAFVGRFHYQNTTPLDVVEDIQNTIKFNIVEHLGDIRKEKYLNVLVQHFEDAGILVFQNGIVKSNTSKPLEVREFRGFALFDDYVPAVFINGKDAQSAKIFTLLHEIAHIWIGSSGVSDWTIDHEKIEAFCNQVAAHFLMPDVVFEAVWDSAATDKENLQNLERYFKVSQLAIAIKAKQKGLVHADCIKDVRKAIDDYLAQPKSASGGSPYASMPIRNSRKVTQAILSEVMNQNLMLTDAAKLLNSKPKTVMTLYKKQNGGQ